MLSWKEKIHASHYIYTDSKNSAQVLSEKASSEFGKIRSLRCALMKLPFVRS